MADLSKHSDGEQPEATKPITFVQELESLINRYSIENETDTPDFLLADYLRGCLDNLKVTMRARDSWYNFQPWEAGTSVTDLVTNSWDTIGGVANPPSDAPTTNKEGK